MVAMEMFLCQQQGPQVSVSVIISNLMFFGWKWSDLMSCLREYHVGSSGYPTQIFF